jgi:hypothetical protein
MAAEPMIDSDSEADCGVSRGISVWSATDGRTEERDLGATDRIQTDFSAALVVPK